jgi:four helix bundle protein
MDDKRKDSFKKLEELIVWQKAKELSVLIYRYSFQNENIKKDFPFNDQMKRAALSIPLNIAEGYGREGNKELINFLSIAKGSLNELKTILIIGEEIGYIPTKDFNDFNVLTVEVEKLIGGFSKYLRQYNYSGVKFKNEAKEIEVEYGFDIEEHLTQNSKLKTQN